MVEQFNQSIQNKTKSLLIDSGLLKYIWILAIETAELAVHIYNYILYKCIYYQISIKKPNINRQLKYLRIFICIVHTKKHVQKYKPAKIIKLKKIKLFW